MNPTKVLISDKNKEGLIRLEEIIADGKKLKTLTTIGSFALVFSGGFSIGTVVDIATTDWQLIANTAKSCSIITRGYCKSHCEWMYIQTDDYFWAQLAQQFK